MNKPIPQYGGKKDSVKDILKLIPYHNYYIEVFGGGASLLFAKKPSYIEVYNDINDNIWNFFIQLRDNIEELVRIIDITPISRHIFDGIEEPRNDIERAAYFYLNKKYSMHSLAKHMQVNKNIKDKGIDNLKKCAKRISKICIERKDFKWLITRYDRKDALFYLDPPYYIPAVDRYYESGEGWSTKEKHIRLYHSLRVIKGKFILSYNNVDFIKELYKDYNMKVKKYTCNVFIGDPVQQVNVKEDLIIWNF